MSNVAIQPAYSLNFRCNASDKDGITHGLEFWLRLLVFLTPFMKKSLGRLNWITMLVALWILNWLARACRCLFCLITLCRDCRFLILFISMFVFQMLFQAPVLLENSVAKRTRQWLPHTKHNNSSNSHWRSSYAAIELYEVDSFTTITLYATMNSPLRYKDTEIGVIYKMSELISRTGILS